MDDETLERLVRSTHTRIFKIMDVSLDETPSRQEVLKIIDAHIQLLQLAAGQLAEGSVFAACGPIATVMASIEDVLSFTLDLAEAEGESMSLYNRIIGEIQKGLR